MTPSEAIRASLSDPVLFARQAKLRLRAYQIPAVQAITDSILNHKGLTFCVVFSRQAGKNEIQAQIQAFLLSRMQNTGGEIVMASPTFKPQTENALRRITRALERNPLTKTRWQKESGYIRRIGECRVIFLSAEPHANTVGATASLALFADEAQDIQPAKWHKDFIPMTASTNATVVYFGTIWTSDTLLATEMQHCEELTRADGIQRVFSVPADVVGGEVPAYAKHVAEQVRKHGRQNPIIKSQYFLEAIDATGGLFPPSRRALMLGDHPARQVPAEGKRYALLIDIAGADEDQADAATLRTREQRADSTAITIVEIDLTTLSDPGLQAPTYRVVERYQSRQKHPTLYGRLKALAEAWRVSYVVPDATGIGAGVTMFLQTALGERVIPFTFTAQSKSQLGWDFLSIVDSGRFKDWKRTTHNDEAEQFWKELEHCQYTIVPGPARLLRWGVPDGTRDKSTGELIHDDYLMSAALCAVLDKLPWSIESQALPVPTRDPLDDEHGY